MEKIIKIALIAFIAGLSWSCKEELVNQPIAKDGKPAAVTGVTVTSGHGSATLKFRLADEVAQYVLAEYESRPGVMRNTKASKYKNELVIDGFARAGSYPVTLYAVSEGEQKSEPTTISVDILTPPVVEAFGQLVLKEDFGGLNISFPNAYEGDLAVDVLTHDEFGKLVLTTTAYTSQKEVSFSVRGFESEPRQFFVVLRDRWENKTDTATVELTPIFEEQLDPERMEEVHLPTDTYQGHSWSGLPPRGIHYLFDGITTNATDVFHIPNNAGVPSHFTIDLGATSKLSRFKIWMRNQEQDIFAAMAPRLFEVYGSNSPAEDGSWESWTLLGDYEMTKPSGLPRGELSAEDRAAHAAGLEFNVSIDAPAVRYLRIRIKETWGILQTFSMAELALWGDVEE